MLQAFRSGNSAFEKAHGGSRRQIWDADEGGAVPPDLAIPGTGGDSYSSSRQDFQDLVSGCTGSRRPPCGEKGGARAGPAPRDLC